MTTTDQRLDALEKDVNRVLEDLTDKATINDTGDYEDHEHDEKLSLERRLLRLEKAVAALILKARIIKRRKNDVVD